MDETIQTPSPKEERAIVLDYLEHGYPFDSSPMKSPVAQALGLDHLTLLELVPKKGIFLQPHEEVYIGEGKREKIHHIKGRIPAQKLTVTAHSELKHIVKDIVSKNEKKFTQFFNEAQPLSTRMHQLELLPGLGKKHMWEILQARKEKIFENFSDLKKRVKLLPDPQTLIVKRIISELEGKEKYRIFVG
jgi:putative nucleotide binding protein